MTSPEVGDLPGDDKTNNRNYSTGSDDGCVCSRRPNGGDEGGGGAVGGVGGSTETTGQRRTKRAQVSRACPRCRKLQKACSQYRPCQRCTRAGLAEQCVSGVSVSVPTTSLPNSNAPDSSSSLLNPSTGISGSPGIESATSASSQYGPPGFHQDDIRRQADLLPLHVIEHCSTRFFERLFPTIPILTPEYLHSIQSRTVNPVDNSTASCFPFAPGTGTESSSSDAAKVSAGEGYCVLLGLCAMVMLQVEESTRPPLATRPVSSVPSTIDNKTYGLMLLEEAQRLHRSLAATRRSPNIIPTLEFCQLSFFIYACHAALMHHSQAFFFLREATTLYMLLRREDLAPEQALLADRLFWALVVSERSHAIRYRRPITLQITSSSPPPVSVSEENLLHHHHYQQQQQQHAISTDGGRDIADPAMTGFRCLAALFRPLDTFFIALHGQEEILGFAMVPLEALDGVEAGIDAALGNAADPGLLRLVHGLQDVQKANLRVTQAWLRIVVWQLRLRLGHLIDDGTAAAASSSTAAAAAAAAVHNRHPQNSIHSIMNHDDATTAIGTTSGNTNVNMTSDAPPQVHTLGTTTTTAAAAASSTVNAGANANSRTYRYPLAVARDLALWTRDLPLAALAVHGAGITEKLFDVACAVVNVLARVPVVDVNTRAAAEADFVLLRGLITRLPGGSAVYAELLEKHVRTTTTTVMPGVDGGGGSWTS